MPTATRPAVTHLVIKALAGCGKTTTLIEAVRRLRRDWRCSFCSGSGVLANEETGMVDECPSCKGMGVFPRLQGTEQQKAIWRAVESGSSPSSIGFCAFNTSIRDELQRRAPERTDVFTINSLGFRIVRQFISRRLYVTQYRTHDLLAELHETDSRTLQRERSEYVKAVVRLVSLCKLTLWGLGLDGDPTYAGSDLTLYGSFPFRTAASQIPVPLSSFPGGSEIHEVLPGIYPFLSDLDAFPDDEDHPANSLLSLAESFDLELNGDALDVVKIVPAVLTLASVPERDCKIDFNDQVWLPIVRQQTLVRPYDLLLVDEAQDLNRCQQALTMANARRLVYCGDPNQAIYGFAGADSAAMQNLEHLLHTDDSDVSVFPLTRTYRCGKAIVELNQKLVPEFEAAPTNPPGKVDQRTCVLNPSYRNCYRNAVRSGDMILCRTNAPIVREAFAFLREKRPANIMGRDIGEGILSLLTRFKGKRTSFTLADCMQSLESWHAAAVAREMEKEHPNETRLLAIDDKFACVACFIKEAKDFEDLLQNVKDVFSDDRQDVIMLSSIHKSKGLERDRIFLLQPLSGGVPHPMAKSPAAQAQERNLLFVAQTRPIHELYTVYEHPEK